MIRVLFICHGNICRSTMSQFVFQDMINQKGLTDQFYINSAATSREEIGNGPHYGTVNKMKQVGIPVLPHLSLIHIQMCIRDRHWNGQRILIQTVSHNMRVQDTVIMMKHMITAIWMCTAGCTQRFPKFRNIWIKMEANPSFWQSTVTAWETDLEILKITSR